MTPRTQTSHVKNSTRRAACARARLQVESERARAQIANVANERSIQHSRHTFAHAFALLVGNSDGET